MQWRCRKYISIFIFNSKTAHKGTSLPTASKINLAIDTTELEALIAEFSTYDKEGYTVESFTVYEKLVNSGIALLSKTSYTKDEVDKITAKIKTAKAELIACDKVNEELVIYDAVFKTKRVTRGRIATLAVTVSDNVSALEIYDDLGELVTITSTTVSPTETGEEGTVYFTFKFKATQKGERTYSIYAIDADGNLSTDPYTVNLTVV